MKIVIEIPDYVYEHAKNGSEDSYDEWDAMRAIAKGFPYEERPHGEWKKIGTTVMCSVCEHGWGKGHAPKDLKDYNFCPNCGADMRVKDELNRVNKELNSEIEKSKSEMEGE